MWRYLLFFVWISSIGLALCLPFINSSSSDATDFIVFIGRFHPVVLHFPIVLVLLIFALELWNTLAIYKEYHFIVPMNLIMALLALALTGVFGTIFTGFLLYYGGDYQGTLIRQHLWGAIFLAALMSVACYFFFSSVRGKFLYSQSIYQMALVCSVGVVFYTSHLGGQLTHGEDFLTDYLPVLNVKHALSSRSPEELLLYEDLIRPIIEDKCLSCHNEYKTKGGLLMSTFEDIKKGGKSGKAMLVSSAPDSSELYRRLILPLDHDDHMPPAEKPQLTEEELFTLKYWIEEGGEQTQKVGLGPAAPENQLKLQKYINTLTKSEKRKYRKNIKLQELTKELTKLGDDLGLKIMPDTEAGQGYYGVSVPFPAVKPIDDQTVIKLRPYSDQISKLSLPATGITDDVFYEVAKMSNLKQLFLLKTQIDGSGLVYLNAHERLEKINLSFTSVDNYTILNLTRLPSLQEVYLFQTAVDSAMLKPLQKFMANTKLLIQEGPYY